jgi:hypothetical protein
VRAIRSALVARLPLLDGLRFFFDVEAWLVPGFAFALPDVLALPLAAFSLVVVDGLAAGA